MENLCSIIKRQVLMLLSHDGRKYRIVADTVNDQGDLDIFLEQKVMEDLGGKSIWLKVSPELADKNNLTVEQITVVLNQISRFINDNFFII